MSNRGPRCRARNRMPAADFVSSNGANGGAFGRTGRFLLLGSLSREGEAEQRGRQNDLSHRNLRLDGQVQRWRPNDVSPTP
jgi:hypothetical protein